MIKDLEAKSVNYSAFLWLASFATLAFVAIAILGPTLNELAASSLVSLHLTFIFISAGFASFQISKIEPNLIVFMVWNFNYCVFGVAAFYQLKSGSMPWRALVDSNSYIVALYATLAMSIVFTISVWISPHRGGEAKFRLVSSRRLHILAVLLLPFLAVVVSTVGGVEYFFTSRNELYAYSNLSKAQRGLYLISCQSLALIVTCLAIREYRFGNRTSFTFYSLAVGASGMVIVCNPLSSSRYWVVTCLSTLALSTIKLSTFRLRSFAVVTLFGTLVIFPLANYFRNGDRRFTTGISALLSGDYDALQLTGIGVEWWQANGIVWGNQLLGAAFFWVPRSVWTDKPYDTGIVLATWAGLDFTNLSGPWVAEALINFGIFGILIFPVFLAWCVRRPMAQKANDDFGIVTYAFLVGYTPILIRGSLIQAMGYLATFLGFLLLATRPTTVVEVGSSTPLQDSETQIAASQSAKPKIVAISESPLA